MKEPKLNTELLRKVRDRIAEIPESYNQNNFWLESDKAPCGTVACLAGEAIICSRPTVKQGIRSLRRMDNNVYFVGGHPITLRGAKLLGLTESDAALVFDGGGDGWPQPYRRRFQRAVQPETKAKIAVAYLDECLKRGKMVW